MNKESIRLHFKEIIKNITDKEDQSYEIYQNIINNSHFQNAQSVLIYFGIEDEVSTTEIINYCFKNNKKVYIPFLRELKFAEIKSFDDLKQIGKYYQPKLPILHYPEPITLNPGLCIIPGLAFDRNNNRLGRGSGWYDKYLSKNPEIYKIGICFKEQLVDDLPSEENDIKMNEIVVGGTR